MEKFEITTQKQVRKLFWDNYPVFLPYYRTNKKQNEYNCDVRTSFVDFVDSLRRDNLISEKLANTVTL